MINLIPSDLIEIKVLGKNIEFDVCDQGRLDAINHSHYLIMSFGIFQLFLDIQFKL